MNNKEKKVIILDDIASPFISQAIIFLKENADCEQNTILEEAEKIVADYFPKQKKNPPKKLKKFFWGGFIIIAALAALIIKLF